MVLPGLSLLHALSPPRSLAGLLGRTLLYPGATTTATTHPSFPFMCWKSGQLPAMWHTLPPVRPRVSVLTGDQNHRIMGHLPSLPELLTVRRRRALVSAEGVMIPVDTEERADLVDYNSAVFPVVESKCWTGRRRERKVRSPS